ncbi:MAG: HD domain-containing protein [Desulfuromonadales bacterium]|nr:HD domain-containing protein [Desulfuromonadales bacterium]
MEPVSFRESPLAGLASARTFQEKLLLLHQALKLRCSGIDRISVALYDDKTTMVKTFLASPAKENPLQNYRIALDKAPSLLEVATKGQPRVVNDLRLLEPSSDSTHTQSILGHGFCSSYTHPMLHDDALAGFVFFDSMHKRYFRERVMEQVELFAPLISELVMGSLMLNRTLTAALRTSVALTKLHDLESGNHLERMSRYARLIASRLVSLGLAQLDDEQLEHIFLFAPLHDVGKIGIPEHILNKPGKLDSQEREVMNAHTMLGRQIVDDLIENFGFETLPYIDYLRNITESHHETMDGSGYPHGLQGEEIALEARITAVSDIFDALTSRRPYKKVWSNDQAFAMLQLMSIDKLDKDCVEALLDCADDVALVQRRFVDDPLQDDAAPVRTDAEDVTGQADVTLQ